MKLLYLIKSNNRINSISTSSFTIPIIPSIKCPKTVSLKYLSIPNTIYNIHTYNNNFTFIDPINGDINIIILPGYYNIINLCNLLSQQMTNLGSQTYNVVYNSITFLLTITAQNNFAINFNIPYTCATLLGFNAITTSQNNNFIGTKAINLQTFSIYDNKRILYRYLL